ncbi:MAG: NAD-dependent epimerase/dehydratase family protein [Candidatus Aminicenantes bacterium]|nr:NAD-dependent epimerase/dehydratase family protein [Candidatus Aminicenantes bacterium]
MNCLVTGTAGFIGSHLSRRLLKEGFSVIGVDSFTDYYPRWIKERNLSTLKSENNFSFLEEDINSLDLNRLLQNVDCVFHLAAQAGVRASWGQSFSEYIRNNIEATQRLLEESKEQPLHKFIYASSSSVYGYCPELPMSESSPLLPYSPYGVTKLAAENLCYLYSKNYGVPTISLRFFTVYGPGQRPDMAFHKFFKSTSENKPITVFGTGEQTRDFTYINDIIDAIFACIAHGQTGETYNLGGGNRKMLKDLLPLFEEICGKKISVKWEEKQKGDVPHTLADIQKAKKDLGFAPRTAIDEGLSEEWRWIKNLYSP